MAGRPRLNSQERFEVGHVLFRVTDHREHGITFALFPNVEDAEKKPALFSGHIKKGMGTELRRLAHHFDDLEAKLPEDER